MMRLFKIGVVALMTAFFVTSAAEAIEVSVIGSSTVTVLPGEAFSFELAIDNASLTSTVGIDLTLSGMQAGGAVLTSGQSAVAHFTQFCSPSACFGGLNTIDNAFYNPSDLGASGAYTPGDDSALVANTISTSGATAGAGVGDPGLVGALNEPSALDVVMNLVAQNAGTLQLFLSGNYSDGTDVIGLSGPTLTVNVVPEPGTALLMGLGLAGLAGAGRRK
jgi:hypothetical protein